MEERVPDPQALGRLEGKMDLLLQGFAEFKTDATDTLRNHGERLERLENWRARSAGYLAGGAAVLAVLFEVAQSLLK